MRSGLRSGAGPNSTSPRARDTGLWRNRRRSDTVKMKSMKFFLLFLLPALSFAGIWPENFGSFHRTSAQPVQLSEQPLWDEYGFQQAEQAQYEAGSRKFTATAYRLQDSTGAMAVFEWKRVENAKNAADSLMLAQGNYVLDFKGYKPSPAEISSLIKTLPRLDQSLLPALRTYLPTARLVAHSERYVTGPVGLGKFYPGVPTSTAAFHMGAEAQLGSFQAKGGSTMKLAIFSYPTPQIARERLVDFQRISGAMVKRSGPLVSVILSPASPE